MRTHATPTRVHLVFSLLVNLIGLFLVAWWVWHGRLGLLSWIVIATGLRRLMARWSLVSWRSILNVLLLNLLLLGYLACLLLLLLLADWIAWLRLRLWIVILRPCARQIMIMQSTPSVNFHLLLALPRNRMITHLSRQLSPLSQVIQLCSIAWVPWEKLLMAPCVSWFLIIACKVSVFLIYWNCCRRSSLILWLLLLSIFGFILAVCLLFFYWVKGIVSTSYPLKVLEGYHNYSHVVQRLAHQAILKNAFDAKPAILVNTDVLFCLLNLRCGLAGWSCAFGLLSCFTCQPNGFSNIIIC